MKYNAMKTRVYLSQTIDNYSTIVLRLILVEYSAVVKTRKCFKTNLIEMFICPNENGVSALICKWVTLHEMHTKYYV